MKMDMNKQSSNNKKVHLTSANLSEEKLFELRRILPEAFSENKIDWEKLRTVLGDAVDAHIEKFGFTWAGKSNAIKNVLIPSKATLNPAPDESVKFDESENLFIEGDNLEVLKLLQKAYFEKVKMIYIDPPYNTGGDFVYKDNFAAPLDNYLKQTGQKNGNGEHLTTNKETNGRFHSDWLSMMYPRLKLAWNLLRDDGVIFVSIDDNEVHHLRILMNEIFGEENFITNFVWHSSTGGGIRSKFANQSHQYVLCYAKSVEDVEMFYAPLSEDAKKQYKKEDEKGVYREKDFAWKNSSWGANQKYFIECPDGEKARPKDGYLYRFIEPTFKESLANNMVVFKEARNSPLVNEKGEQSKWNIYIKKYLGDGTGAPSSVIPRDLVGINNEGTTELNELFGSSLFESPKNVRLLTYLLSLADSDDGDIILDFFAGSGSTSHAVMALNQKDGINRKWIVVQLPEKTDTDSAAYKAGYKTIAELSVERIRRAAKKLDVQDGFKVFRLAASNYPENTFEFDPDKAEEENKAAFEDYLKQAKRAKLIDDLDETSVIYENIVKEGFSLNSKIQEGVPGNNKVYTITDGDRQFSICLDRSIDDTTVKNITEWAKGATFICFDNALSDSQKANLGLHVELKTI